MNIRLTLVLLLILAALSASLHAELIPLFNENFDDSPPYQDGSRLPLVPGEVKYGRWLSDGITGDASMLISVENFLSAPQGLALRVGPFAGEASATSVFGELPDSSSNLASIRWKINFCFEDGVIDTPPFFSVRDTDGKNVALLYIGDGGVLRPNNIDCGIIISPGVWYTLEIVMPFSPNPDLKNTYTLSVSENKAEKAEVIYFKELNFFEPSRSGKYAYATVNMRDKSNSLFLDDWQVTAGEN